MGVQYTKQFIFISEISSNITYTTFLTGYLVGLQRKVMIEISFQMSQLEKFTLENKDKARACAKKWSFLWENRLPGVPSARGRCSLVHLFKKERALSLKHHPQIFVARSFLTKASNAETANCLDISSPQVLHEVSRKSRVNPGGPLSTIDSPLS